MTEFRKVLKKIIKTGKIEHFSVNSVSERLEYCEVTEATFDELAKVNEVYPIDLIEGYDTDNITIFFK